jgi:hypothetical protein
MYVMLFVQTAANIKQIDESKAAVFSIKKPAHGRLVH